MTQSSWPFENADTTESQYSKLFDRLKRSGVAGFPSDTALKVTGDSSGMNVKVGLGFAIVRGFAYELTTSVETLTIGASSANPRIDLVCLKLDPTVNSVVLEVVAGTPAVTPTAPSLTQSETGVYELEIGRVAVPALATVIAAGDVSDTRPCLGDAVGVWTSTQRPTTGRTGQVGWSTTNEVLEVWNGSTWIEAAPQNIDAATITSGTLDSARIGSIPVGNIDAGALNPGELLGVDATYNIIGVVAPQILQDFYNNPTVGTTLTTSGTSLDLTGSSQYQISFTAHVKDTDSVACTVTARLTVGATNYDYTSYIPANFTGQVTATRYLTTDNGDTTNVKVRLKVSTGSRNVDTFIVVVGMN